MEGRKVEGAQMVRRHEGHALGGKDPLSLQGTPVEEGLQEAVVVQGRGHGPGKPSLGHFGPRQALKAPKTPRSTPSRTWARTGTTEKTTAKSHRTMVHPLRRRPEPP